MKDFHNPVRVAILGSTGSVGTQAVDALSRMGCRIVLLSAGKNTRRLIEQARFLRPETVTLQTEQDAADVRLALAGENIRVLGGEDAVLHAIAVSDADVIIHSIAGLTGLPTAMAAARTGARLGMANKEAIIAAGDMLYAELQSAGGELIPVDSEHSAIFQCLNASSAASVKGDGDPSVIRRILLTASGGPFYGKDRTALSKITVEDALRHPTWQMGSKITVDSATLMNKGFEVIEACRLFGVKPDRVEVLIHRQSIIHSMVEYIDNTVIAQLGLPDMRSCIRYAVSYPDRAFVREEGIDFLKVQSLTFDQPDRNAFPLLDAATAAMRRGGTAPTALIAADEVAVAAFIAGEISFSAISQVVLETMERTKSVIPRTVSDLYEAEKEARALSGEILKKYC